MNEVKLVCVFGLDPGTADGPTAGATMPGFQLCGIQG